MISGSSSTLLMTTFFELLYARLYASEYDRMCCEYGLAVQPLQRELVGDPACLDSRTCFKYERAYTQYIHMCA